VGKLFYGDSGTSIVVDDRTLAHLKIAVFTKLRRNESFTLSWQHGTDAPSGRSTIWVHPSVPLHFIFDEDEPPVLNKQWIEQLMRSANSTGGIQLLPEDAALGSVPSV